MERIINRMSSADIKAAISSNNNSLVAQLKCSKYSFRNLNNDATCSELLKISSYNLRSYRFYDGMKGKEFADAMNEGYEKKDVRRFQDYQIRNIATEVQEPSAITIIDGSRMDLLGGKFYTYTEDGFTFAPICNVVFENNTEGYSFACYNYFKTDGHYYCTTAAHIGSTIIGIILWEEKEGNVWGETTTPKVFTNPKVILPYDGGDLNNFGNTSLVKKDGTWYMVVEIAGRAGLGYANYLATCATLDGTYTLVSQEPIIKNSEYALTIAANSVGNPEILMLHEDIPYMCDGKYYMMCHYMMHDYGESYSYLYRYYSYDLIHWEEDGYILTGRDANELPKLTNADACWHEFKGKSYLFYMKNANQYLDPSATEPSSINCLIDNRPMSILLRERA